MQKYDLVVSLGGNCSAAHNLLFRGKRPCSLPVDDAEVVRCRERLQTRFPGIEFDLLCFQLVDGLNVAEDVTLADGVRKISFDFGVHGPKEYAWKIDVPKLLPWLSVYSVRDYRTFRERRLWKRRKKWRTMNAHGALDYLLTHFQYKLFRHFEKALRHKGVAL